MNAGKILFALLVAAYAVMWIGGVGHYVLKGGPPLDAPWAASVFLTLAAALVVASSRREDLTGLSFAALIGFVSEILGVHYGFIFSPYRYTDALQPQFLGAPLVMMGAWMTLVSYVRQMLMSPGWALRLEPVIAAAWMTAIDLVIDPLAANQLGYWRWEKTGVYYGVPLHNFAGWFAVSLIIFSFVKQRWEPNKWARRVGLSIVLFFTVIALSNGLALAGSLGIGLCVIHFAIERVPAIKSSAGLTPNSTSS